MNTLLQDIRFAFRTFARTPGMAVLAIVTLGLGIGANAAIFSVVENVLISPLPYPDLDRVALAGRRNAAMGDVFVSPAVTDVDRWRTSPLIEAITTFREEELILAEGDEPTRVTGARVEANLLDFTGTRPVKGRGFTVEDAASEASARVVMLSEGLWRRRFGADAAAIGQTVELSDQRYQIVGVLPENFRLPTIRSVDFLTPLAPPPPPKPGARPGRTSVSALARLKEGVTFAAAEQSLTATGLEPFGKTKGWTAGFLTPSDLSGDTLRRALYVLLAAVGCVLLIGCANVANLLLARNAGRRRELAVRIALGASRWRLTRQLLTENILLAVAGGLLGVATAFWAVDAISAVAPPQMGQLANIRISRAVFGVALLLSVATGLIFGLLPALTASRLTLTEALKQGGRAIGGVRGAMTRRALSVAEIALALVLLSGAGLLIKSYAKILSADLGFQPRGLIAVTLNLPDTRYPTVRTQADFATRFTELVRKLPGVQRAVLASGIPPKDGMIFGQLHIEGRPPGDAGPSMFGGGFVEPGFFEALNVRFREGRGFTREDVKANSVVVNESMARRYWPGESAVGKRLRMDLKDEWSSIVGVVGDLKSDHARPHDVQIFMPMANPAMGPSVTLLVAVTGDPAAMIPAINAQVWAIDSKLPVNEIQTVEESLAEGAARPRFNVILLTVFAGLGLLLATIGVYGVISHSVGLRTQEIGVRMALGAIPADIRRAVLREALTLSAVGTALGAGAALLVGQAMAKLLFGVSPRDVPTLAAVAVLLAMTSVLAAWVPARRAMRVDPMVALRNE